MISFKALKEVLPHVVKSRHPILIRSRHGVGKSTLVYDMAEEMGLPVVERRISQMPDVGDLLGMPCPNDEKKRTEYYPPEWLLEACNNPVILFFDEVDRGEKQIRQALFELTDSRKIAGVYLHPDTIVIAAVNGDEDNTTDYGVDYLNVAELDRWTTYDVDPTIEDWVLWAAKSEDMLSIIVDFIRDNPVHLEHEVKEGIVPNKVYPSRRSWHRCSTTLRDANLVEPGKMNVLVYNIVTGFVGFEAASAFADYVRQYKKVVSVEDILNNGKINLTKDFIINDHLAWLEKAKAGGFWNKELLENQISNIAEYLTTALPAELAMKMLDDIAKASEEHPEAAKNISELYRHRTVAKCTKNFLTGTVSSADDKEKKEQN